MDSSRFAERLRELRTAAGLSQTELAEKAGMTQGAVGHLERGTREPQWASVVALADALGVSCEAFRKPPDGKPQQAGRGRPKGPADPREGKAK
jgi:transcriptional regulator with XRE-family HTH domain